VVGSLGQKRGERSVGLLGTLDLRHVSTVEFEMAGARKSVLDVAREGDRDEPVAAPPDEQRISLKRPQPRPEALLPVRLLEIDMACCSVEGGPAGRCEIGAQELVDAGGSPAFIGARNQAMNDRLDRWPRGQLDEAELADLAGRLRELEIRVSAERRGLHERIDTLQAELVERHKTGRASVDGLLS